MSYPQKEESAGVRADAFGTADRNQSTTRPLDVLLPLLDNVRDLGGGDYRANCTAGHRHARRSLSIREESDGRLLLWCFVGCDKPTILGRVGLTLADLYPRPLGELTPLQRRERSLYAQIAEWRAAISMLRYEKEIVRIVAGMILSGDAVDLDAGHLRRLREACDRLDDAWLHFAPPRQLFRPEIA